MDENIAEAAELESTILHTQCANAAVVCDECGGGENPACAHVDLDDYGVICHECWLERQIAALTARAEAVEAEAARLNRLNVFHAEIADRLAAEKISLIAEVEQLRKLVELRDGVIAELQAQLAEMEAA
jgi:hypothetical protein